MIEWLWGIVYYLVSGLAAVLTALVLGILIIFFGGVFGIGIVSWWRVSRGGTWAEFKCDLTTAAKMAKEREEMRARGEDPSETSPEIIQRAIGFREGWTARGQRMEAEQRDSVKPSGETTH